jgi:hypothetical protein
LRRYIIEKKRNDQGLQALDQTTLRQGNFYNVLPVSENEIYLVELGVFFVLAMVAALTGNVWLLSVSVGVLMYLAKQRRE